MTPALWRLFVVVALLVLGLMVAAIVAWRRRARPLCDQCGRPGGPECDRCAAYSRSLADEIMRGGVE